jgi:hypothetical protein
MTMKKVFALLLLAISFVSCDIEGDENSAVLELGPIHEVTMPTAFKVDSISQIMVRYYQPTSCHMFNGFYYDAQANTRTVAIEFLRLNQDNCDTAVDVEPYEVALNFKPLTAGTYLFKFYSGTDANGEETFVEAEAVVPQ